MSAWALLHFFAFLTNLYGAVYVLLRNPRAALNRIAAATFLCFALWSFGLALIRNTGMERETAVLINNLTSPGWMFFCSLFLTFTLVFAGRARAAMSPWFFLPAAGIPLFFSALQFNNLILERFVLQTYGWVGVWAKSAWTDLYLGYYLVVMGAGLFVVLRARAGSVDPRKRKQALVLVLSTLGGITAGTLSSVVLRRLEIYSVPPLGDVATLIWTAGIFYATVRYRLFELNPATAADKILETMTESLLLVDPEGKIVSANAAALALTGGSSRTDLVGRDLAELFPGADMAHIVASAFEAGDITNVRAEVACAGGPDVPVLLSAAALRDSAGRPVGIVCVFRDFTEILQVEERLTEARDAAEQANRAKTSFLAVMSHEMRTPLNAILGYTQLLIDETADPERRTNLAYIEKSGNELLSLINEILDFAKIESGTLRLPAGVFSLSLMLSDLERSFRLRARDKGLILELRVSPDVPRFTDGAGQRLAQVVGNLMDNAIKFTSSGSVRVECDYLDGWATICVSDTGPGVTESQRRVIFDPFSQADMSYTRSHGGIGLGLAICRRLVEMMGGTIDVKPREGGGSIFALSVPLPAREVEEVGDSPAEAPPDLRAFPPGAGEECEVLIADDNELVRTLLGNILARMGISFDFAENGKMALEMLAARDYHLLLMDIQMPEMDGVEAIRRVRDDEKMKGIFAVALTAHALEGDEKKYLDAGFDGYVSKPIDLNRFTGLVRSALERKGCAP